NQEVMYRFGAVLRELLIVCIQTIGVTFNGNCPVRVFPKESHQRREASKRSGRQVGFIELEEHVAKRKLQAAVRLSRLQIRKPLLELFRTRERLLLFLMSLLGLYARQVGLVCLPCTDFSKLSRLLPQVAGVGFSDVTLRLNARDLNLSVGHIGQVLNFVDIAIFFPHSLCPRKCPTCLIDRYGRLTRE